MGTSVAGPEDLGDGTVHRLSILLDPALYTDRSIRVTVEAYEGLGALVNEITLHDVDYRYADSGGPQDRHYPYLSRGRAFGWLDGSPITTWGTLPYKSGRVDQVDEGTGISEVRYRFDDLDPAKRYRLHLGFYQGSGVNRVQRAWIDDLPIGSELTIVSGQRLNTTVQVPASAYADGSITAAVRRTGATVGTLVSEVALEEETQLPGAPCGVAETPTWTLAYGSVTIVGQPAPAGTLVTAESSRGEVVGCFVVEEAGQYGFMHIYGEDNYPDTTDRRHAGRGVHHLPGQRGHGGAQRAAEVARRQGAP